MSKRDIQAPRRQRGVIFSSCKSTEKIVDDSQQERAGVVIDMARALQARRDLVTPNLRKPRQPNDAAASSGANGVDHLAPTPQPRDRTVGGMQTSFRRLLRARLEKSLGAIKSIHTLGDNTRYRANAQLIDDAEEMLLRAVTEAMRALRFGRGSKTIIRFSDEVGDEE